MELKINNTNPTSQASDENSEAHDEEVIVEALMLRFLECLVQENLK